MNSPEIMQDEQQPVRIKRKVVRKLTAMALQGAHDGGYVEGYNAGLGDGRRIGEKDGYRAGFEAGGLREVRATKALWGLYGTVFGFALCAVMYHFA